MDLSKLKSSTVKSKIDSSLKITTIEIPIKLGEPLRTLFISDVHTDAPNCDRKLLFNHMRTVKRSGGLVFVIGDMWDLMQTRNDPRRSVDGKRPEDSTEEEYLDLVIESTLKFYDEFKDNIAFIGRGNHEDVITRYSGTNITKRFIKEINSSNIHGATAYGAYSGIIRLKFMVDAGSKTPRPIIYPIYYHHGAGGNARRTKGVLNVDMNEALISGVRMYVSGHDHNKWHMPRDKFFLGTKGELEVIDVHHMKLGSYLSRNDWATSKGFENTRRGGFFSDFSINRVYKANVNIIEANENSERFLQ